MTYSSSLNSGSIVKVRLLFEFGAQELSNDVFTSIVRRRENRLWYMANQTDGTLCVCLWLSARRILQPEPLLCPWHQAVESLEANPTQSIEIPEFADHKKLCKCTRPPLVSSQEPNRSGRNARPLLPRDHKATQSHDSHSTLNTVHSQQNASP